MDSRRAKNQLPIEPGHEANAWAGRFFCADEVERYLGGERVTCLLCSRPGFRSLVRHLAAVHGCSADEYRVRFGIPAGRYLSSASSRAQRNVEGTRRAQQEKARLRREAQNWTAAIAGVAAGEGVEQAFSGTGGRPTRSDYKKRRLHDPEFCRKIDKLLEGRPGSKLTADEEAVIVDRLKAGESSAVIARTLPVPRSASWIGQRRLIMPDFAARTAPFWRFQGALPEAIRAEKRLQRERRQQDRFAPHRAIEQFRTALRSDEVYAAVYAAARRLPSELRDDVMSDLVVAILSGAIVIADLHREVGRFRTAHNRMFGGYAPSLDAPIGDGAFTLGNSLVAAYI